MRLIYLLLFTLFVVSEPVFAGYEEALAAYKRGQYDRALEEWQRLAVKGHTKAQFNLATMYAHGQGVSRDYANAIRWYRSAALRGDAESQAELAHYYFLGRGVKQDLREANEWSRIAAKAGIARAQHLLGVIYATGQGAPQDYVQAHVWFSLASAQGDKNATKSLKEVAKRMTPNDVLKARRLSQKIETIK